MRFFPWLLFLLMSHHVIASSIPFYVGTYTRDGRSQGIYASAIETGAAPSLKTPWLAAACSNPSFLSLHPSKPILYATGDTREAPVEGVLMAFDFSAGTDKTLQPLGSVKTGVGYAPCHLVCSPNEKLLLAAHYNTGVVVSVSLDAQGHPVALTSSRVHAGAVGPNKGRQDRPHAHSVTLSPDGRYAYVCDLGMDRIFRYDIAQGRLDETQPSGFQTGAGEGPRHAKFGPGGHQLYVLNELAGSLNVFACAEDGSLKLLQTLSTLETDYKGENTSAEIQIHPSGRFVYASNRGPDSLAVFARDLESGLLQRVQLTPSGGKHPRHFALSPDGGYLACANRDTNNVVLFRVDAKTGALSPTGQSIEVPQPVCLVFPRP